MKIAIDIRPIMDPKPKGVGHYTLNILKNLLEIDNTNEYILFYNQSKKVKLPPFLVNYKDKIKIKAFHYPNKLINLSLRFFKYPKIDKLLDEPDIFFSPNLNFFAFSKNSKTKKILTIHDLSYKIYPEFFSAKGNFWHKLLEKNIYKFDKLITISQNTKRDLINQYKIPEEKFEVIYSGINSDKFSQEYSEKEKQILKNKYNLPEKYIFFLATFEPRKNIESLIQSFNIIRKKLNIKLVLAGAKGWKNSSIFEFIKKSPNNQDILVLDYVEDKDKAFLYQNAALFLFPSFYEGFGFPPLEAMSAGCPVVAGLNSSLPEICGKAALLVNPYSLKEISQASIQILTDSQLRNHLIEQGFLQSKKFSWQNTAKNMLELFLAMARPDRPA